MRPFLAFVGGGLAGSIAGPLAGAGCGLLLAGIVGEDEWGRHYRDAWRQFGFWVGLVVGPVVGAVLLGRLALRRGGGAPPAQTARRALSDFVGSFLLLALAFCVVAVLGETFWDLGSRPRGGSSNETAAIATLRMLASCQAQIQTGGTIDCDGDGIGEHGTLLEMTGAVPVRAGFFPGPLAGSDFSARGKLVSPPILPQSLSGVDSRGFASKAGYLLVVYLPDTKSPAGFVHETGPAASPGLTGRVGVELAETTWCAYAWPVEHGKSGIRCFFVNQAGDVLMSPNRVAKWSGRDRPPAPDSAFLGAGITSAVAIGTRGRAGDFWRVVE